ncbi:hypothetical protein [Actinoplanes sp. NPDC051411]|uniref:hypothetical protein n=1 Tax=Actinoplanes sp. NPDC051411 TaxID=3155522 RepID=UPI00344235AA
MHLAHYLGLLDRAHAVMADALRQVAAGHAAEADIAHLAEQRAARCEHWSREVRSFARTYAEEAPDEPERLHSELFRGTRGGGLGLLRDLQDLYLMTAECDICWTVVEQAARGIRDDDLAKLAAEGGADIAVQLQWLRTRMKAAAPQALVVAD